MIDQNNHCSLVADKDVNTVGRANYEKVLTPRHLEEIAVIACGGVTFWLTVHTTADRRCFTQGKQIQAGSLRECYRQALDRDRWRRSVAREFMQTLEVEEI
ncbi:hypothetical protein [Variovorax saccharolyticus]|uniref:hypothetical protein n=1 Tax=Variovorax saccharolyticus TaxID=3053516 RepID=UPI002575076A|nr:hypothetical protein [Variovorax sp. J31P216]MDM0029659.1 hypothetical protein [Variovorax sp. J31P216]